MRKYLLMLSLTLPLLAQQTETDKEITKQEQRENRTATIAKQHSKKDWNRGGMKRGVDKRDKRMMMAKRKKMQRKRFWRSAVRVVVIGGVAYYVGLQQGKKHRKGGMKKPGWDRKDKK